MTNKEKKVIFTAIGIMVVILLLVVIVKSVGKKKPQTGEITNSIAKNEEKYVNTLSDGTEENNANLADGSWNDSEGVNAPLLVEGLTAITFNSDGSVNELAENDYADWYDYANGEWANAITKDTSGNITGYWVWIPRYEYKINSSTQTTTVKFIPTSQTTADNGYDHVHPAFCDGSATHYMNGEWDEDIPGFWVAKFPAGWQSNTLADLTDTTNYANSTNEMVLSDENYTQAATVPSTNGGTQSVTTDTQMSLPVFTPLTYTYNYISIGDSYTLAKQVASSSKSSSFYGLSSSTDSHMLKNSEWGAVAYLTQSQYGRNGTEPYINNFYYGSDSRYALSGVYADGQSTGSTQTITSENAWYSDVGKLGSSTKNMTGVYDLNGCTWERVAGYITNGNSNLSAYGSSFVKLTTADADGYKTLSTKYATVYPYNSSSDSYSNNWTVSKGLKSDTYGYGDAILETSIAGGLSYSWYSDFSYFAGGNNPFFDRGGRYDCGYHAGVFGFCFGNGVAGGSIGFRVVLVP